MEDQNKEPGMGKLNRILWYIMGGVTLIIFIVVFIVIILRGTGY